MDLVVIFPVFVLLLGIVRYFFADLKFPKFSEFFTDCRVFQHSSGIFGEFFGEFFGDR